MKTTTLTALTAALFLSTTPLAFAQTVDAGGDVTVDGEVDAEVDGDGVSVDAEAGVDADAEADATVTDTENDNDDTSLDTDGDGMVSDEESAAGGSLIESCSVADIDLTAMSGADQADAIAAATSARVVRLTDCEDDAASALGADVQAAVTANAIITGAVQREGSSVGDILGISVEGEAVTVYLRSNESEGGADDEAMDETSPDAETDAEGEANAEGESDASVTVTQ